MTVIVRAGGFAEETQQVTDPSRAVDVTLEPATLLETVTVTPTRTEQRLGDVPASVSVVTSEAIEASPALLADDVLRQVPSFSLFRRTSSLVAQPTAQGVSLRGIGPSGQSRTLVLLDGIPFNDPFGGWVYWTRVPLESVDRVEITEDSVVEPLRQHRDGRRHQHHHQPSDAAHDRAEAAVRQPQQPEVRLLRAAISGTRCRRPSKAASCTPTGSRSSRRSSAARSTTTPT